MRDGSTVHGATAPSELEVLFQTSRMVALAEREMDELFQTWAFEGPANSVNDTCIRILIALDSMEAAQEIRPVRSRANIGRHAVVDTSTTTRALRRLIKQGLVCEVKAPAPHNQEASLTDAGRAKLALLKRQAAAFLERLAGSGFPIDGDVSVITLLRITQAFNAALPFAKSGVLKDVER
jgi:DNA-binding MarR family transcriptional regulator